MSETAAPDWLKSAVRIDRPQIDVWYKPDEHGTLDGHLIWRGQQEHPLSGEVYNAYAVRLGDTGKVMGVSERAGLRGLRSVRVGSRVYIKPTTVKELEGGRKMQQFEIFADHQEALTDVGKRRGPSGGGGQPGGPPADSDDVPF